MIIVTHFILNLYRTGFSEKRFLHGKINIMYRIN